MSDNYGVSMHGEFGGLDMPEKVTPAKRKTTIRHSTKGPFHSGTAEEWTRLEIPMIIIITVFTSRWFVHYGGVIANHRMVHLVYIRRLFHTGGPATAQ